MPGCWRPWRPVAGPARLVESTSHRPAARRPRWLGSAACAGDGIDALNLHRREWTRRRVDGGARAPACWAFGWDAQTRAEITGLLDAGVDGVYSDHVDVMMAAIRGRRG